MYKEKYLKYKTKYLDLQSQLGGNPNIIQEGGGGWFYRSKPANKPSPPPPPPEPKPTTESAIEILKYENMFQAIYTTIPDERNIWSSDQDIVNIWNSVCEKINTGTIIDIFEDWKYKINITLDDEKIAIITMPDKFINYDKNIYYMNIFNREIKILTIATAIQTLTQKKINMMIPAIIMTMNEYNERNATNESRIIWSLDQDIVDTWNSIYGKILTGKITDVSRISDYKINITLDNENIAIITMPDGFINYNEKTYSMNIVTGEINILTIALAIETLTQKKINMMIPAIIMTMAEYDEHDKTNKSRILWSNNQEIIDIWNSVYKKINTGTIEDIFVETYKIRINLDGKKTAIISMPSGSFDYIETISMPDGSFNYNETSYFMDLRTGLITKSTGA
jgi:hypothetical protein